jgi:hypothetical protein
MHWASRAAGNLDRLPLEGNPHRKKGIRIELCTASNKDWFRLVLAVMAFSLSMIAAGFLLSPDDDRLSSTSAETPGP